MSTKRILIVDDEPDIRELLEITLGRMKLETEAAQDLTSAYSLLENISFDLCLTDMHLPDGNGIELVEYINKNLPELPVAMITAFGSTDTAVSALKAGAFDFVQKPIDLEQLRSLVHSALKMSDLSGGDGDNGPVKLLGDSPPMEHLRAQIRKLSRSQAPIYISGESGSGKEVAARLIHSLGPRHNGPFVPVNCGAIPTELMESEFFGHVKGSFTGAVSDKQGLFQAANGGTLFLDEVADLPLSMQVKLLRAIQEKAVRPVGSQSEDISDVRILSATHKDLAEQVAIDNFRQDLYYRLNVIELRIPALRDHLDDLQELTDHSLNRLALEYNDKAPSISAGAKQALANYDFPGNIRELENILERAFTLCEDNTIEAEDLQLNNHARTNANWEQASAIGKTGDTPMPDTAEFETSDDPGSLPSQGSVVGESVTNLESSTDSAVQAQSSESHDPQTHSLPDNTSLEDYLENIERVLITRALESTRWNKTAAAKQLGITFRALRYKLKKLDME